MAIRAKRGWRHKAVRGQSLNQEDPAEDVLLAIRVTDRTSTRPAPVRGSVPELVPREVFGAAEKEQTKADEQANQQIEAFALKPDDVSKFRC